MVLILNKKVLGVYFYVEFMEARGQHMNHQIYLKL